MGCIERFITDGQVVERDCRTKRILGDAAAQSAGPGLLTKAIHFTKSAVSHVAAGMPRASDAEVERRFAICQGCEFYDGKACTKCGCPVVRESRFLSKLAWANEACPVGKWGPASPQSNP